MTIKRSHRLLWSFVPGGDNSRQTKCAPERRQQRRFNSPGNHHVNFVLLNHARRITDRVAARRAARTVTDGMPFNSQFQGNLATAAAAIGVDQRERAHGPIASSQIGCLAVERALHSADRCALNHPDSIGVHFVKINCCVPHGLD